METQPQHRLQPDAGRGRGLGRPVCCITVIYATSSLLSDLEFVSSLF